MQVDLSVPTPDMARVSCRTSSGLAKASLRIWWHRLFDPVPKLAQLLGPERDSTFDKFMRKSHEEAASLNWTLHLAFLSYLESQASPLLAVQSTITELLAAAGSAWAGSTFDEYVAVRIRSKYLPVQAIIATKNLGLRTPRRVVKVGTGSSTQMTFEYEFYLNVSWAEDV